MPKNRLKLPEDHGDWGRPYEQADFFGLDRSSVPLRGKEPSAALIDVALKLISAEGPIHEDLFFRHFREAQRLASFPARSRNLVYAAVEQLKENGEITHHNDFLDLAGRPCRVARWQVPNAVERPLEHVATSERQVALLGLISESPGIPHDEAIVAAAGFFGWGPRTRAPKSALLGDLYRLRDQQKITGWPDSLRVAPGQDPGTTAVEPKREANADLTPPSTYPLKNRDDPWDSDAVNWAYHEHQQRPDMSLLQFFQLCRRQPGAVEATPEKAAEVDRFLKSIGIEQRAESRGNGTITRLYRTDSGAPQYPASPTERRRYSRPR